MPGTIIALRGPLTRSQAKRPFLEGGLGDAVSVLDGRPAEELVADGRPDQIAHDARPLGRILRLARRDKAGGGVRILDGLSGSRLIGRHRP